MRQKLAQQFSAANAWDLKFAAGGLVDVEFIAQTSQLAAASRGRDVLDTNTIAALRKLGAAGALTKADVDALVAAASLQQALMQVLRIALEGPLNVEEATPGLKALLVRAAGADDFPALERHLAAAQAAVRAIFARTVG
jgi:glutamate-ammonia-ligase adenylyltransferase